MPIVDRLDRVSFWRHPIAYLYQSLLTLLIGARPVVVNVTLHRPEDPQGPLMYWPEYVKRPLLYNINLDPINKKHYPHDPLITSNPE